MDLPNLKDHQAVQAYFLQQVSIRCVATFIIIRLVNVRLF